MQRIRVWSAGSLACFLHDRRGVRNQELLIELGWLMRPPSPGVIQVRLELAGGEIARHHGRWDRPCCIFSASRGLIASPHQTYCYLESTMFAGHLGAALAIGRAERRLNVGVFVVAALFLDLLLWGLVLLGWESVSIPANFASTHQPVFVFPYSHGLLAALLWSGLGGAAVRLGYPECKPRAAILVGAAVLSHWVLDALVHVPELPLTGPQSTKLGFGLWQSLPVGLGLEALIVVAGLALFLPGAQLSGVRKAGLATLVLVVLVFTVLGMTLAPPPPSAAAMAASSLLTLLVVCGLAGWLGRPPREPARVGR